MAVKILIAEDEPHILELIKASFLDEDVVFFEAQDGLKALELAKVNVPDLIILDVMMPEISGYDVCKQLKKDSLTASIPVVIYSAKGNGDDVRKGYEAGAALYILKPFSPLQFVKKVMSLLKGR